MSFPYAASPPVYTTVNGGAASGGSIFSQSQQAYSESNINADVSDTSSSSSSSSSSSVTSSITIVIIVLSSAIIVTASIYILLRFLSRRFNRTYATTNDVVFRNSGSNNNTTSSTSNDVHVARKDIGNGGGGLNDSLPLFKFGSVTRNLTGGDCAVCLSKFELHDQLRLLPLCCHAFHARCIDAWLSTNQTCPLCRSTVNPTDADVLNKILSVSNNTDHRRGGAGNYSGDSGSFRIEIGSISSRQRGVAGAAGDRRRSYSVGSFEYILDNDGYEVSVDSTHRRAPSVDKELREVTVAEPPPGEILTSEITSERSWLREYVDRLSIFSLTSRTTSLRSSGRFFSGSSRQSDAVVPAEDLEANANRMGEEISELFRWLSGV